MSHRMIARNDGWKSVVLERTSSTLADRSQSTGLISWTLRRTLSRLTFSFMIPSSVIFIDDNKVLNFVAESYQQRSGQDGLSEAYSEHGYHATLFEVSGVTNSLMRLSLTLVAPLATIANVAGSD